MESNFWDPTSGIKTSDFEHVMEVVYKQEYGNSFMAIVFLIITIIHKFVLDSIR